MNECMPSHLKFEQWVSYPIEKVFLFFANPENLARIMPAPTDTKIDQLRLISPPESSLPPRTNRTKIAGIGSEIITSFRVLPPLPFRALWIAQIVDFAWNHHFADIQKKGPFKSWHHRHEFAEEIRNGVAGTVVRDVIDYEVGYGPFGKIGEALFVKPKFRSMFKSRQSALPALLA